MQTDGDQLVIRTGAATVRLLAAAVTPVSRRRCLVALDGPITGVSVHTAPLSVEALARYARYADARISITSLRTLAAAGLRVILTPLGPIGDVLSADPLHATLVLDRKPTAEALDKAATAFQREIDNPFPRAGWPCGRAALRDLSVIEAQGIGPVG